MKREVIFHGKMPDPFAKPDGTRMTPEEWQTQRDTIRDMIVDIGFGGMPPRPEVVEVEYLNSFRRAEPDHETSNWIRIHAGTKEKQITFCLEMYVPYVEGISPGGEGGIFKPLTAEEKYPIVLTGDGCYCNMERDVVAEAKHSHSRHSRRRNNLPTCRLCSKHRLGHRHHKIYNTKSQNKI